MNTTAFKEKARHLHRKLLRKLRNDRVFYTGTRRKRNRVLALEPDFLLIITEKGNTPFKIDGRSIRAGINLCLVQHTVSRKELQSIHNYTTALFGLLHFLFDQAHIRFSRTGLMRLTLPGVRYFFSGIGSKGPSDLKAAIEAGARFFLLSFYYIRYEDPGGKWKEYVKQHGIFVVMDSGEFTRMNAADKGKDCAPLSIQEYADYIKENKRYLMAWFNLDDRNSVEISRRNAAYLTARGLDPIEVWHPDYEWEELERIVEKEPAVIAIGGTAKWHWRRREQLAKELFERFPEENFHLFGCASLRMLTKFPWFSSDATSWLYGRMRHTVITWKGQRKRNDWSKERCLRFNVRALLSLEKEDTMSFAL